MSTPDLTTLSVPSISCGHCKSTIEKALAGEQGVRSVEVDIEGKTVQLDLEDAEARLPHIVETLDDLGYSVAS